MRTLKKTLCLVLCLAMMAGLCVFASADFKDQDKIENEEAVAVLTGIGVIQGDDKGNFNPEGTLTRAEATVIITKLLGAADIKATTDKFTDVKADFWGMPYIAYCVAEGVVAGMGDGTFAPNAKLTGYQWATLLLRALGYKIEGETWQIDVAKLVKSEKLAEGMTFVGTNEITRQEACQMAFNALDADMVEYVGGSKVTVGGIEIVTGAALKKTGYTLQETYFKTLKSVATPKPDKYGRPASSEWTYGKDNETIYKGYEEPVLTVTDGTFKATAKAYADWDFSSAKVFYNGAEGVLTTADVDAKLARKGYNVSFYGDKNKDGGYDVDVIVVTEYYFAEVTDVDAKSKNIDLTVYEAGYVIAHGSGKKLDVDYDKTAKTQTADYEALKDLKKGDYIAVCLKPGWDTAAVGKLILDTAELEEVTGTVTAKKVTGNYNGYVKVDGEQYDFAWDYCQAAVNYNDNGTFFLYNGFVLGFAVKTTNVPDNYIFVMAEAAKAAKAGSEDLFDTVEGDAAVAQLKVLDLSTGKIAIVDQAVVKGDDGKYYYANTAGKATSTEVTSKKNLAVGKFYTYTVLDDGSYVLGKDQSAITGYTTVTVEKNKATIATGLNATSTTKFTVIDVVTKEAGYNKTVKSVDVKSVTGIANFPKTADKYTGSALVLSNKGIVSEIIVVKNGIYTPATTKNYAVYAGLGELTDKQAYGFYVDGKLVNYNATTAGTTQLGTATAGTLYEVTFVGGEVNALTEATVIKKGEVTFIDSTFIIIDGTAYYFADEYTVIDEGDDYAIAEIAVGDTVSVFQTSGKTDYVVIAK